MEMEVKTIFFSYFIFTLNFNIRKERYEEFVLMTFVDIFVFVQILPRSYERNSKSSLFGVCVDPSKTNTIPLDSGAGI